MCLVGGWKVRSAAVLLGVGLLWSVLAPVGMAQEASQMPEDDGRSPALCGPDDAPESGIQGDIPRADQESGRADDGYNCGLTVVGHNDLDWLGGGALAWAGHCAYVKSRSGPGIQVIDVSDPTGPVVINEVPAFDGFGSGSGSENMHAVITDERAVLVYGRGVYDVSDCENPEVLGEIQYPELLVLAQPHNVKLSPDGTKVIGTMPLTVADITNLDDPSTWEVRYFQCEVAQQVHPVYELTADPVNLCSFVHPEQYVHATVFPPPQLAHEPEFNTSGTRLYIGGQRFLDLGTEVPLHPADEYLRVLDMTVWPPKVLGETFGPGHGINFATIDGREYVLNSDEGGSPGSACKPPPRLSVSDSNAEVYLTDISDETAPRQVSTLRLAINNPEPEFCAAQEDSNEGPTCSVASSAASTGCSATPHYHMVDDPNDTTFAMLSMMSAGLRVWDVRDPENPTEVAYFNPGQIRHPDGSTSYDPAGAYAHYDASTGHIWVTTRESGFWVLELQPQVREHLRLDEGRVGRGQPPWTGKPESPGTPEAPVDRSDTPPAQAFGFAPTAGVPPTGLALDSPDDGVFNYCRI